MADKFDPAALLSRKETLLLAQTNPSAALDRCEYVLNRKVLPDHKRTAWEKVQLQVVSHVLATVPPVPKPVTEEKKGENNAEHNSEQKPAQLGGNEP